MRKIIASEFVTLDGVMEDPGGAEKFERGGWAFKFNRGPEGDQFKLDEVMSSEALLLGRVTYEAFASAWPSRTGEFADKMNGMTKYVVSATLQEPEWHNTRVLKQNVIEEVTQLKSSPGDDILIAGSGKLVNTLVQHNLIDEYRLMVYPVILGKGKRLFEPAGDKLALKLVGSKRVGEGILILTYHTA
jgi:dihydrofolate reductase